MNRRSFLGFLGLSPVIANVAVAEATVVSTQHDYPDLTGWPPSDSDPWSGIPRLRVSHAWMQPKVPGIMYLGNQVIEDKILQCRVMDRRDAWRIIESPNKTRAYFNAFPFEYDRWKFYDKNYIYNREVLLHHEKYGKLIWGIGPSQYMKIYPKLVCSSTFKLKVEEVTYGKHTFYRLTPI